MIIEIKEHLISAHGYCIIYPRWNIEILQKQLALVMKKVKILEDSDARKRLLVNIRMAIHYITNNKPKEADKQIIYASDELLKISRK